MNPFRAYLADVLPPTLIALALDIVVTFLFLGVSSPASRIGALRPLGTVPSKSAELVSVGLLIGLIASLSRWRRDAALITLGAAFVLLLDADHLPAILGIAQPIRPAHTFTFLAIEVAALALVIRNRPEVELIAVSAFLGHIGADTGIYAPLAPFSFSYVDVSNFRVVYLVCAVAFAVLAGYAKRRRLFHNQSPESSTSNGERTALPPPRPNEAPAAPRAIDFKFMQMNSTFVSHK